LYVFVPSFLVFLCGIYILKLHRHLKVDKLLLYYCAVLEHSA
jgi:hypothetical protein